MLTHEEYIRQLDQETAEMPIHERILYEIPQEKTMKSLWDNWSMLIGKQYFIQGSHGPQFRVNVIDQLTATNLFGVGEEKIDRIFAFVDSCIELAKPVIENEKALFDEEMGKFDNEGRIFRPYSLKELMERPAKQWSIDRIFGQKEIGMFYGLPGSGKSFALVDFALTAAIGGKWANEFQIERAMNVAYCAGEGVDGMASRFAEAARAMQVSKEIKNLSFFELVPQLNDPRLPDSYVTFIQEQLQYQANGGAPFDLIIIDTLHTATVGAKENDAGEMGVVLANVREINKALGTNILFAHHSTKTGETERGSIALRGAMDIIVKLEENVSSSRRFIMRCEKLKDGDRWEPREFELNVGEHSASIAWLERQDHSHIAQTVNQIEQDRLNRATNAAVQACKDHYPESYTYNKLRNRVKEIDQYLPQSVIRDGVDNAIEQGLIVTQQGKNRSIHHCYNPDLISLQ